MRLLLSKIGYLADLGMADRTNRGAVLLDGGQIFFNGTLSIGMLGGILGEGLLLGLIPDTQQAPSILFLGPDNTTDSEAQNLASQVWAATSNQCFSIRCLLFHNRSGSSDRSASLTADAPLVVISAPPVA